MNVQEVSATQMPGWVSSPALLAQLRVAANRQEYPTTGRPAVVRAARFGRRDH